MRRRNNLQAGALRQRSRLVGCIRRDGITDAVQSEYSARIRLGNDHLLAIRIGYSHLIDIISIRALGNFDIGNLSDRISRVGQLLAHLVCRERYAPRTVVGLIRVLFAL